MRGTPDSALLSRSSRGIIPAYAGNTSSSFRPYEYEKDHPRICGEHHGQPAVTPQNVGSSPHMRGTLFGSVPTTMHVGIIPAYAGNTMADKQHEFQHRDHPRICVEHRASHGKPTVESGSSPHMRGTPIWQARWSGVAGIIPAYAGNTTSSVASAVITGDHPRICGEHRPSAAC